jgi:hypothetical protein
MERVPLQGNSSKPHKDKKGSDIPHKKNYMFKNIFFQQTLYLKTLYCGMLHHVVW